MSHSAATIEAACRSLRLTGLLALIELNIGCKAFPGRSVVRISIRVPSRDTEDVSQKRIDISKDVDLPHGAHVSEEATLRLLRRELHSLLTHEADEGLLINGVRRWDPHADNREPKMMDPPRDFPPPF